MSATGADSVGARLTVCIVGGGSSAHVLVPLLSVRHRVHLLTRRPADWSETVVTEVMDATTGTVEAVHYGRIARKSSEARDVVPGADVVVLCLPVHQYRAALDRIGPHLSSKKEVFVGTVYGQGGFNWMVRSMVQENSLDNVVAFAIGPIPWICRTLVYGRLAHNFGAKQENVVAVAPAERFDRLEDIFLCDLNYQPYNRDRFHQASDFLSLTLSVDNQILHPARCYGLWQASKGCVFGGADRIPYFYKDFDEASAENVRKIDAEYTLIRSTVRRHFPDHDFPYLLSYLELENFNHGHEHSDILGSVRSSKQLAAIKTPCVRREDDGAWVLDTDSRFFTDDIPFGLLIGKWIAERLGVATPFLDEIIQWAQALRGERFLTAENRVDLAYCLRSRYATGIPPAYGIRSVDDILD